MAPETRTALVPFALHRHRCGRVFWIEARKLAWATEPGETGKPTAESVWLFFDQTRGPNAYASVNCCPGCETLFDHEDFEVMEG